MPTYQLSLLNYYKPEDDVPGKCATEDELVKWVWAPDRAAFDKWVEENGIKAMLDQPAEQNIDEMGPHAEDYGPEDGVDVMLSESGKAMHGQNVWLYWPRLSEIHGTYDDEKNVYEGKIYRQEYVFCNGKRFDHKPSLRIVSHSPTGFSWGYCGSGSGQLALAILLHETGQVKYAIEKHHEFMRQVIAKFNKDKEFRLTSEEVLAWMRQDWAKWGP